jgi:hypothetical protein
LSEQALTLRDAVSLYNAQVDLMMKFFTFLQVISGAIAGFMWSTTHAVVLHAPVAICFTLFALGNGVLVFEAYRDAENVRGAIRAYRENHPDEIPSELSPIFSFFKSYPGWQLAVIHIFVDVVTIVAIVRAPGA